MASKRSSSSSPVCLGRVTAAWVFGPLPQEKPSSLAPLILCAQSSGPLQGAGVGTGALWASPHQEPEEMPLFHPAVCSEENCVRMSPTVPHPH